MFALLETHPAKATTKLRPDLRHPELCWLVEYPDLPSCMSDGETIEEAIANSEDAKRCWIAAMKEAGRPIAPPSVEPAEGYSGKWQLRAPKSLHRRLAERAKREGVSLNTLAVSLLAEGLGERSAHGD
jgi:antitoxin HicB